MPLVAVGGVLGPGEVLGGGGLGGGGLGGGGLGLGVEHVGVTHEPPLVIHVQLLDAPDDVTDDDQPEPECPCAAHIELHSVDEVGHVCVDEENVTVTFANAQFVPIICNSLQ